MQNASAIRPQSAFRPVHAHSWRHCLGHEERRAVVCLCRALPSVASGPAQSHGMPPARGPLDPAASIALALVARCCCRPFASLGRGRLPAWRWAVAPVLARFACLRSSLWARAWPAPRGALAGHRPPAFGGGSARRKAPGLRALRAPGLTAAPPPHPHPRRPRHGRAKATATATATAAACQPHASSSFRAGRHPRPAVILAARCPHFSGHLAGHL